MHARRCCMASPAPAVCAPRDQACVRTRHILPVPVESAASPPPSSPAGSRDNVGRTTAQEQDKHTHPVRVRHYLYSTYCSSVRKSTYVPRRLAGASNKSRPVKPWTQKQHGRRRQARRAVALSLPAAGPASITPSGHATAGRTSYSLRASEAS